MTEQTMQDRLDQAIAVGSLQSCANALDAGADVNFKHVFTAATPLHHAAHQRSAAICQLLIDRGAELFALNKHGESPLHVAAAFARVEHCRVLVKAAGANLPALLMVQSDTGHTPFQTALKYGHSEAVVRFFVLECGEDLAQKTMHGETMMTLAQHDRSIKQTLHSLKTEMAIRDALPVEEPPTQSPALRADGIRL